DREQLSRVIAGERGALERIPATSRHDIIPEPGVPGRHRLNPQWRNREQLRFPIIELYRKHPEGEQFEVAYVSCGDHRPGTCLIVEPPQWVMDPVLDPPFGARGDTLARAADLRNLGRLEPIRPLLHMLREVADQDWLHDTSALGG